MSRTVAVTGATGFIGRHVTAALASRGDRARAIVRPGSPRAAPPDADVVFAPLTPEALAGAFAGCDTVVHLAGVVSAAVDQEYVAVNVDATREVAAAARAAGAFLVHISSLAAAGPAPAAHPRGEDDPARPITTYGITKLAGELAVRDTAGLAWTILRPGVVYGEGDRALLPVAELARMAVVPLVGRPDGAYMFVHVDDLVRAMLAAIDRRSPGLVCFVGHERPVSPRELMERFRDLAGRSGVIVPIPRAVVWIAANVCEGLSRLIGRRLVLDRRRYDEIYSEGFVCRVDRLRDRLGAPARIDIAEGLTKSAAWYTGGGR